MKAETLTSLNRRYQGITTLLDPRFKEKFFSSISGKASAVHVLKEKVNEMSATFRSTDCEEPPPKQPKTDIIVSLTEILEESGASV